MRIPTTESRRGLDTGAGTLSTPRLTDAVGPSLRSLGGAVTQLAERYQRQQDAVGPSLGSLGGGAVTQLAERYQRQQDADQAMRARKSFLDFQSDVRADYEAALENAPENGAGLHESWIVGTEDEPGVFDQRALGFIASLPESLRGEYMARVEEMRDGYDDQLARDQLEISQSFSNSVITQQMEVSVAAISRNPGTFEDQLEDVTALVVESGLPVSQAVELLQASERQLAMIAARAEMERDPDGFGRALDDHQSRYGARRIDAVFEAAAGEEAGAAVRPAPSDRNQTDEQSEASMTGSPIATRGNTRSRVEGAFEAVEQTGEEEGSGNLYDPILQRLEPSQIDDLRFELEDARFEEKRRADYNAAALRRTLDENLKSIRGTGWPAQEIDSRDVKDLLGEEEAEKYETGRTVARTIYRAVQATAGLPEEEVRPEIENIVRRSGVDPSSAEAVTVEALQQQQVQQDLQQSDPARSAEGHPAVLQARAQMDVSNREDVAAYIMTLLNVQATEGIDEVSRSPISENWRRAFRPYLRQFLGLADQPDNDPYQVLRLAYDVVRDSVGNELAGGIFLSTLQSITTPPHHLARAERVVANAEPFDSQLPPGGLIAPEGLFGRFPGLEQVIQHNSDAAFHRRVRHTFDLARDELERMPPASGLVRGSENAWPPFEVQRNSLGTRGIIPDEDRPLPTSFSREGGWFMNPMALLPEGEELPAVTASLSRDSRHRLFGELMTGLAGLSEAEMHAELNRLEASTDGSNTEVFVWARQAIPTILRWRNENPALAFETEVLGPDSFWGARSGLLGRYDRYDSLRWQQHVGIPEGDRRFLVDGVANIILREMRTLERHAVRDAGLEPVHAMITSIDAIRRIFGDELARTVAMEAIAQSQHGGVRNRLIGLAERVFDMAGPFSSWGMEETKPLPGSTRETQERIEDVFVDARNRLVELRRSASVLRDFAGSAGNLGTSTARGLINWSADVVGGIGTIPTELRLAGQESIVRRIRSAPLMMDYRVDDLRQGIIALGRSNPEASENALKALDQILDGSLSPEDLTKDMIFTSVPNVAELAFIIASQDLREWGEEHVGASPHWEDHFTTAMGEALGENAPAVLMALSGPARVSRILASGATEILALRGDVIEQALEDGVPPRDIYAAATLATLAGAVGAVDLEHVIRIPKLRNALTDTLIEAANNGTLDATQAGVEQILENLAVRIYDEDRAILEGVVENTVVGYTTSLAQQYIDELIEAHHPNARSLPARSRSPRAPSSIDNNGASERRPLEITVTPEPL